MPMPGQQNAYVTYQDLIKRTIPGRKFDQLSRDEKRFWVSKEMEAVYSPEVRI